MSDPYWKQFMHTVHFDEPRKVEGFLEGRNHDGNPNDPYPVLLLRTKSGYKLKVNVTQTRLLGELIRNRPDLGDFIEIVYHGPAPKAPPGMSPVKEFTVNVTRRESRPPSGSEKPVAASENATEAGGKT